MLVVLVAAVGVAVLLLASLAMARWSAARALDVDLGNLSDLPVAALPEGHRPPPGLMPISPSERSLALEITRGLRALELFLLDAA
ncbi:MAG: hypothetical protein WCD35_15325 [Mycobacteriales bacterium]